MSVVRDDTVRWRVRRVCGHLRPSVTHERRRVGRYARRRDRKTLGGGGFVELDVWHVGMYSRVEL